MLIRKARSTPPGAPFALAAILGAAMASGETPDDRVTVSFRPSVAVHYVELPTSDLQSGPDSRVRTREYRGRFGLASLQIGQTALDVLADYQYTRFLYQNVAARDRDLHRLQIPLAFELTPGPVNFSGYIAPGVAASSNVTRDLLDNAGSEDYFITAGLNARIRRSDDSDWIAGATYDHAFGAASLYPVVGIESRIGEHMRVRLAFPDSALSLRPHARHEVSLRLFPAGAEWHVVSEEAGRDFDYRTKSWRLRGTWSVRVSDSLRLDASVGWAFDRRHTFLDDQARRIRSGIDDALLVAIGFRLGAVSIPYSNSVTAE